MLAMAAVMAGKPFFSAVEFARWDSGHYMSIAERGYELFNCSETGGGVTQCSGNAAWFPLLSFAMRAISSLGASSEAAGVLASNFCFAAVLILMWNLLFPEGDKFRNFLALLLAAVFPGSVYYQSVFPISLFLAGMLLSVYFFEHDKTARSGLFGFAAAMSYSTGIFFSWLFPIFFFAHRKIHPAKTRIIRAIGAASAVLAGFISVLALQRIQTGRWNAFFLNQVEYGHGWNNPLRLLWERIRPAIMEHRVGFGEAEFAQSSFVLALMALATYIVLMNRKNLSRIEWILYAFCLIYWIMPMVAGGFLSLYRAEAVLLPVVVILRRLHAAILIPLIFAAVYLKLALSTAFFAGSLV